MPDANPTAPPSVDKTRDHLANERTFLAWIRTALALLGFGFVLARVGLFLRHIASDAGTTTPIKPHHVHEFIITGVVFLCLGTVMGAWAGWHYARTRRAIDQNDFKAAGAAAIMVAALAVVGGLVIIALVLWGGEFAAPS